MKAGFSGRQQAASLPARAEHAHGQRLLQRLGVVEVVAAQAVPRGESPCRRALVSKSRRIGLLPTARWKFSLPRLFFVGTQIHRRFSFARPG